MAEYFREIYRANLDFISQTPRSDIAAAMLAEFQDRPSPFQLGAKEPSRSLQFETMSKLLEDNDLAKLRQATADALESVDPNSISAYGLMDLAYTAVNIRSRESIKPLIDLIQSEVPPDEAVTHNIFQPLTAFRDDEQVQTQFREWFGDDRFERYVGTMMNCLAEFHPEEYPQLLERFAKVDVAHPDYFREASVVRELARLVKPAGISSEDVMREFAKQKVLAILKTMTIGEVTQLSQRVKEELI